MFGIRLTRARTPAERSTHFTRSLSAFLVLSICPEVGAFWCGLPVCSPHACGVECFDVPGPPSSLSHHSRWPDPD